MRDQQPEPVSLGAAEKPSEEVLLNRYRVLARRGTGGFGTVCTCWDTRLQRRVAIKRIPVLDMDDGISASTAEEALGEARTACLLAHPNIVSVLDFEMEGAYAYLIMEYVDGLNLAELLSRVEGGTLSHDECAHMVASIGRALANSPALVLADEPTGNLDSKNSADIINLLRLYNKKYNQTLIVITHDEKIALQADRIIGIEDGRISRDEVTNV